MAMVVVVVMVFPGWIEIVCGSGFAKEGFLRAIGGGAQALCGAG